MIAYGCSSLCLLCHVLVVALGRSDIIFLWILKNILKKFRTTQRFDVGQKSKYQEMLVRAGKVSNTDIEVIGNLRGSSAVDNV